MLVTSPVTFGSTFQRSLVAFVVCCIMAQPNPQLEELRASRTNFPHLSDGSWGTLENALAHFGRPLVQSILNMEGNDQITTEQKRVGRRRLRTFHVEVVL